MGLLGARVKVLGAWSLWKVLYTRGTNLFTSGFDKGHTTLSINSSERILKKKKIKTGMLCPLPPNVSFQIQSPVVVVCVMR